MAMPQTMRGRATDALYLLRSLPERYARPQTEDYIPQIDGLRAVAILLVLLWHGSLRIVRQSNLLSQSGFDIADLFYWLPHGEIGVALFFVISGFVIAQPFLARPAARWSVVVFYRRRLQRLYPPYFFALLICLLPYMLGIWHDRNVHDIPFYPSFIANMLYVNGFIYDHPSRFNPPAWSLEIEIQFYLIAPLLLIVMKAMPRLRNRLVVAVAVATGLLVTASFLHVLMPFDGRFRFGLLAHLPLFITGIALADIARQPAASRARWVRFADLYFWLGCLLLVGLGLAMTRVDANVPGFGPHLAMDVAIIAACLLIYHGAMYGLRVSSLLSRPWFRLVGTMCYSIYLVHVIVIEAISQFLMRLPLHGTLELWLTWWAVIPLAVAPASLLFYIWIERPFMNRRLSALQPVKA